MKIPPNHKEAEQLLQCKGNVWRLIVVIQLLAKSGVIHYQTIRKLTNMNNRHIDESIEKLKEFGLYDDGIEWHYKHLHFAFVAD